MKKEYMNPAMRLVELKHGHHLLAGTTTNPDQYDNNRHLFYKGGDDTIADDNYNDGDVI